MADEGGDCCFICLADTINDPQLGPLGRHCGCKAMFSHRSCLTRWQLQNAGKAEEKQCRFCKQTLGDWRTALTEVPTNLKRSPPIMAVVFQGKTVKVPVVTGPEGVAEFKRTVCKLFNLPDGTDFEVTFECKSPVFGDKLHLKGFDCFEAASYCAAVSAAKRATHKASKSSTTTSGGTSTSTTAGASSSSPSAATTAGSGSVTSSGGGAADVAGSAPSSTSLPALRGARSAASASVPSSSQQQPQSPPQQQGGASSSDLAGAMSSPSRLMRRINDSLVGDRLRRIATGGSTSAGGALPATRSAPASPLAHSQQHQQLHGGSNLRNVTSAADAAAQADAAMAHAAGPSSGELTPFGSSGAPSPAHHHHGRAPAPPAAEAPRKVHGGARSFMRRLRAGMLCTGAPSVDTYSPSPFATATGTGAELTPSSSGNHAGVAAAAVAAASSQLLPTTHSAPAQQCQSRPLATTSAGALPTSPSSSPPSVATLLGTGGASADLLQEPGSPAHSVSAAAHHHHNHHMLGDNAPPAAHVATTTAGSAAPGEAKPSGYPFAGSLVSMFRRVF